VGVGDLAAGAEELLQIIVLAVDVSAHCHRAVDGCNVALLHEDLRHDVAQLLWCVCVCVGDA
jgi:hypothetical protein